MTLVTLSDFNLENLNALLRNDGIEVVDTPYGQVHQLLMDASAACWADASAALVWTRPQAVLPAIARARNQEAVDPADAVADVDRFADALAGIRDRVQTVLVPAWTLPATERGLGMLELGQGAGALLARCNVHLADRLRAEAGCFLLDAQRWEAQSNRPLAPKSWYMAKLAFSNEVFKEAAKDVRAALDGVSGKARKLVVLDLDDTLWGGIVGDLGWENLTLGGHDPVGEAFVDFQKGLKALTNRGILLGVVSKNEESVALEAITSHPEMVLKPDDFAGWRINWMDKAQNLADLIDELNLGLQSVVFIDDNPAERARVKDTLPEVLVPDWPADKTLYRSTLSQLRCFDMPRLSAEDRERAKMYAVERERKQTRRDVGSLDDWLHSLETRVLIEPLDKPNLARAAQLLNKTNQMNLRTRRMTEQELEEWVQGEGRRLWTLRVSDKFGDLGLTGIVSIDGSAIIDFILSCRVFGRKIEDAMVATAIAHARERGAGEVTAHLIPTKKNKPTADFFANSSFVPDKNDEHLFRRATDDYPMPAHLAVSASE